MASFLPSTRKDNFMASLDLKDTHLSCIEEVPHLCSEGAFLLSALLCTADCFSLVFAHHHSSVLVGPLEKHSSSLLQ